MKTAFPTGKLLLVVLNSGFTFAEAGSGSNARQTPKLPDFAVINLDAFGAARRPSGIVTAGFFDERWQLPSSPP